MTTQAHHYLPETVTFLKTSPALAVAATSFLGIVEWDKVLYVVSVIWILVQMAGYLWDRYKRKDDEPSA
jgi:uncharacterized membrane protein